MKSRKRNAAALLCAVFALALLVSSLFLIHEAGHCCSGEDCPICQAVAVCGRLLRLLGAAVLALSVLPAACCAQGMEFVWSGGHQWPEDYPEEGDDILVTGRLEVYDDQGTQYMHLVDSELVLEEPRDE